eukprot:TRINITY_DN12508_c0_g1_i1.p1 TRINITY_DN12508_c0_g1~~TRINITY_DN12508_c0_g1_i1.p1  ORF type:complete len:284 (-),score=55.12 TRINITY_DN12508_c0_g1_i1:34-831(-)
MEDEHVAVDKFGGNASDGFFAVYDGHGGRKAAEYVAEHLHQNILKEIQSGKAAVDSIRQGFLDTDQALVSSNEKSGATAAVAIILLSNIDDRNLYTANVGDARIVLKRADKAIRLTHDHKASDPEEIARIQGLGGYVLNGKVGATLVVARAFGDSELKEWVSAEPLIATTPLTPEDTHIIIACDGLWDVCTDEQAVEMMTSETEAKELSEKLLQYALTHESRDNVSIMVVDLQRQKETKKAVKSSKVANSDFNSTNDNSAVDSNV